MNILFSAFYVSINSMKFMIKFFLAEEEKKCIDSSGRLLFRKPKEKPDDIAVPSTKSDIVEMASNKNIKRKTPTTTTTTQKDNDPDNSNEIKKKTKTQLLSFMDESGFDGDD